MKRFLSLLAIVFAISASAQEITAMQESAAPTRKNIKERLAAPVQRDSLSVVKETVQVSEQGDAATIVKNNLESVSKAVNGYRIVIFMSNSQTARRDAITAQENFTSLFPQEQTYLTYENPYFKVAVGNCTSQEEAIILLGRLRGTFPKAFIMREEIALGEFTR